MWVETTLVARDDAPSAHPNHGSKISTPVTPKASVGTVVRLTTQSLTWLRRPSAVTLGELIQE